MGQYAAIEDPALRLVAIEGAGPRDETAAAALGQFLDSPSLLYRAQAAQTLGSWAALGDAYLVLPALTHKDPMVRAMAQAAYMEHSSFGQAPLVTAGNIIEVPPAVLAALATMNESDGLVDASAAILAHQEELRKSLHSKPREAVLAADILARIGDAGARRALIRLVQSGDAEILPKAVGACVRDDIGLGPTLLPLAFAGNTDARRAVMRAMVVSPDPRLKFLALKGLGDSDAAVRHNAIRAIGNMGAAAPFEELAKRLKDAGPERPDVIRALGAVGMPAADVLRDYLKKTSDPPECQVLGMLALAPNAGRDDIAWVAPKLKSPSKFIRAAAASVLGRTAHPSAQAALVEALGDRDPLVRAAIAKALGQVGTAYAAEQLLPLLKDASPLVASMAAWGLGSTRYAKAVPELAGLIKARASTEAAPARVGAMYGWPELAATEALGSIAGTEAVVALRAGLKSKSWLMRATAVQALGNAGDASPEVVEDLTGLLKDKVNLVRAQAIVSLEALGRTYSPGDFQRD
ncbi:MAG: HEAT repeat domain-containing protein [Planctomycetes bacterium]|nr:HEAT repeat domain-containing protein [Planctomycetota bacterium]